MICAQGKESKRGIPLQDETCAEIARARGLEVGWSFRIENPATMRLAEMAKLIKVFKSGRCLGLIMKEPSHLVHKRNSVILEMLEEHKLKLFLPDREIDYSAKSLSETNGSTSLGDYERSIFRERMVSAKKAKFRRGEWASGKNSVPYGLEVFEDGKRRLLRTDRKKIGRVQDLFHLFIQGGGLTSFAELARQTGIAYDSIDYILRNEIYTGFHVPRKTADRERNAYWESGPREGEIRYQRRKIIPAEERERIKVLDQAPISETLFAEAQRLLALRKEMNIKVREGVADPYLYRGLLRCAECGRKLITLSYTNKRANNFKAEYYVCQGAHGSRTAARTWRIKSGSCPTRRMRREVLEPMLDEIVSSRLTDPKFLAKVIEAYSEAIQNYSEERIQSLTEEIEEITHSIDRNQTLFVRGKISQQQFDKLDEQLQQELKASKIALEKTRPNPNLMTPERWVPIAKQFKRWIRLEQKQKRMLLASVAPTIEAAGYPGKKYHETRIKIKTLRFNLNGDAGKDGSGEIKEEVGDDSDALILAAKESHQGNLDGF